MDTSPATTWIKSAHSGPEGGNCVEVAKADAAVLVRDTKDHAKGSLRVTPAAWGAFVAGARVDGG
ncbi:DUF397 domain-containing protein [Streptomyces sp. BI20]|uniref:DUF397 domain-containing protein n=1 Tax=Streptomyces sp. BI20 TaxID=3403460 RepID=UPI003C727066